jgi:D-aspartate ligase
VAIDQPTARLPVLLLGAHLPPLGSLRVLSQRGIRCYVVDDTNDIITRSRWYRPAERKLLETTDSEVLNEYLTGLRLPRAVLLPCTDMWSLAVSGLPAETRTRFPASVPSRETVETFVRKDRFRALVERLEIPHPRTTTLRTPADLEQVSDEDLAMGFLKPTDSKRYDRLFGGKGAFPRSRADAAKLISEASAVGITFVLQEWIPGDMSSTILLDGFVDRHGTVAAILARRRVRMDPPRIANTACDVTIPLSEVSEVIAPLHRMLAEVNHRGVFNVEYKLDPRDGQWKIIELNPRPFWLVAHIANAGIDLPWMCYLDAQEMPVPTNVPYEVGRYGHYELADASALIRAWSSLKRPEGAILGPWLRGDHTLLWWRDPLPGALDVWRYAEKHVGRLLARLRPSKRSAIAKRTT